MIQSKEYIIHQITNDIKNHIELEFKDKSNIEGAIYSTDELFDKVFLSYAMRKEKPSIEIYEKMTQQTGLDPATTLYSDDRTENAEAGKRFGFQRV